MAKPKMIETTDQLVKALLKHPGKLVSIAAGMSSDGPLPCYVKKFKMFQVLEECESVEQGMIEVILLCDDSFEPYNAGMTVKEFKENFTD